MLLIMLISLFPWVMGLYFKYLLRSDTRVFHVLIAMYALEAYLVNIDDIFLIKGEATYISFIEYS